MTDDTGTFRTTIELENPAPPGLRVALHNVLVDTGAELSWMPAQVREELGIARKKGLALSAGGRQRTLPVVGLRHRPCRRDRND